MFLYCLTEQTEQTISQKLLMSAKQIFLPDLTLSIFKIIVIKQTDRSNNFDPATYHVVNVIL